MFWWWVFAGGGVVVSADVACTPLPFQSYVQHEAPSDVTGDVTGLINAISDDAIEDVRLTWLGAAVHAAVGSYEIVANVTVAGGTRCYTRRIDVTDTDECDDKTPAAWRHRCDATARCVNTVGSYACACEENFFAPRDAPHGCGGWANTSACCGEGTLRMPKKKAATDFEECASSFACEPDLCDSVCVAEASCARTTVGYGGGRREARYECACKAGWFGTGRLCPDGASPPTVFVNDANVPRYADEMPCGCQKGVRDPCWGVNCGDNAECVPRSDGTATCVCAVGFTARATTERLAGEPSPVVCVDETLPILMLRGEASVEITQCGAPYEEKGVRIIDDNAAAYERTLRISYGDSRDFPGHVNRDGKTPYFRRGDYRVSYRVDTPWTTPPFAEATRLVSVVDEDECLLPPSHPCAARCAPHATCVNEVGGYRCVCPPGAVGDGFMVNATPSYWLAGHGNPDAWRVPQTFAGGSGCADVEPPTLRLLGPDPVVIRVERCDDTSLAARFLKKRTTDRTLRAGHDADAEVADLAARAPAALCDRSDPVRCAAAYDTDTVTGSHVDLSSRVVVGRPFRVDRAPHHPANSFVYHVPYSVSDDSGNVASRHRQLILQVMTLQELEAEIHQARPDLLAAATPATCEAPPEQACPPCDKPGGHLLAQQQPQREESPCRCEGLELALRRRAEAEAQVAALHRTVAKLERRAADLERRALVWFCVAILAVVIAGIAFYVAAAASAPPQPLATRRRGPTHEGDRPPPRHPTTPLQATAPTSAAAPRYGPAPAFAPHISPAHSAGSLTPNVVRGKPRTSPFSA